jgi:hypothetical protein
MPHTEDSIPFPLRPQAIDSPYPQRRTHRPSPPPDDQPITYTALHNPSIPLSLSLSLSHVPFYQSLLWRPHRFFFFLATIYVNTLISCMLSFLNFNSSFDHWSMLVKNCDFLWYFIIDPCFYEIWCIIMKLSCEFNHWSALENLLIFIRCWSCKRFF